MTVTAEKSFYSDSELLAMREAVNLRLDSLLPLSGDRVSAAMREGTLTPGKRIRPLLLLLVARDMGCEKTHTGLLDLACSVEMIHAASLMLDDIPCMDNAQTRRGRQTIHLQFGQDVAILAAVALLSKAFGTVASAEGLSAGCKAQAVAELSTAVGLQGLVQGQYQDLSEGTTPRSREAITRTNDLKTSVLFEASLQLAALAADASPAVSQQLRHIARELGQAFQLLDDLSDSHDGTGKDSHQDAGKSTLVALLGAEEVHQRLRTHLENADHYFDGVCHHGQATRHFMHSWFNQQLAAFR